MSDKYIVIIQRAWCNASGSGIIYHSDLKQFDSRHDVISHGIELTHCDDFNIGTLRNGELVGFNWMDRPVKGHELRSIAEEIGLEGSHL